MSKSKPFEWADSMEQAASVLKIGIEVLKLAKAAGCPAFRGGRICLKEVELWIAEHPDKFKPSPDLPDKDTLDRMLKQQRYDERAREIEVNQRKYVLLAPIVKELGRIAAAQRALLQARLENELPQKLAGLDVIAMREVMAATVDGICEVFSKGVEQWQ